MRRKQITLRESIRWRLSISYAGIALLATALLGMILFAVLTRYYSGLERDYLKQNAQSVSGMLSVIGYEEHPSEEVTMVLQNLAFLTDTQIRLMDAENQVVVDTGRPQDRIQIVFSETTPMGVAQSPGAAGFVFSVRGNPPDDAGTLTNTYMGKEASLEQSMNGPLEFDVVKANSLPGTVVFFNANGMPASNIEQEIVRSNQLYKETLYSSDGTPQGSVEISNGPAYGRKIIQNVIVGWAIAGGMAVVLAALAGWLYSRKITSPIQALLKTTSEMASGNLSARAGEIPNGEFGVLATRFNEMADQVESKVNTLKRFVADAAHELHTPLTALRTHLDLITADETTPERNEHLEGASQQVERITRMMDGLLALSKLEESADVSQFEPINLVDLVYSVVEPYASQADQREIDFKLEIMTADLNVFGNFAQLRILIENILDNAIKFTQPRGSATVALSRTDDQASFKVIDTGIGISTEDLPFLFSRFQRGRNAAKIPGSGLGLAIVKAIADNHHATIAIDSNEEGTCVEVRFSVVS